MVRRPAPAARPTMVDVARAAEVSLKTVSRVFNNEPGVTPQTADRVRHAIALLDFRRNDMARGLRQRSTSRTLGLLIEDVANPFYSAITAPSRRWLGALVFWSSPAARMRTRCKSGHWLACSANGGSTGSSWSLPEPITAT